ncbi:MAG: hypothetical protein KGH98_01920 [Candidatus Micrarchaeota archaeon]|nr:hypothetical protein [Candidatus Micrarchaeota archaeon]
MAIFNLFGKKDVGNELVKNSPFRISTELVPYRLYANKKSSATLNLRIKNLTGEPLLTSVVVEVPEQLGFDNMNMGKQREVRMGEIAPGEEKNVGVELYNSIKADAGEYTLSITAMAHYRDYGHILNAVKKRTTVNVV